MSSTPSSDGQSQTSFESQFAECLNLLKGPSDERRFVGLLLVTKLLPQGGDPPAIRRVYEAVGPTFISRLLLPLQQQQNQQQPTALSPEELDKKLGTVSLGISVLATLTQVPDIAAAPEVVELLPLILNVVREGSLRAALVGLNNDLDNSPEEGAQSTNTLLDCLQTAVAIVHASSSSSTETRRIVCEPGRGVLDCVARVVARGGKVPFFEPALWALRLAAAALLLQPAAENNTTGRNVLLEEFDEADVARLVVALSKLMAAPVAAANKSDVALLQHAATLQLEALSVLLSILPATDPTSSLGYKLRASSKKLSWPENIRTGISILLKSKTGANQRHGALQLAAAAVELLGPQWMIGCTSTSSTNDTEGFYQLLTEITRVEIGVLLLDALAPEVPVPSSSHPGPSADNTSRNRDNNVEHNDDNGSDDEDILEEDDEEGGLGGQSSKQPADLEALRQAMASGGGGYTDPNTTVNEASEASTSASLNKNINNPERPPDPGETKKKVDQIQIPTDMKWSAGPSETSGQRALRMLPICFTLLEAEIDVLVASEDEYSSPPLPKNNTKPGEKEQQQIADEQPLQLSDAVADRAMKSIEESAEVVLQYLEQTLPDHFAQNTTNDDVHIHQSTQHAVAAENKENGGVNNNDDECPVITLAAMRVLCRFCAEAPDALGPRVRAIAPKLIAISTPPFILPPEIPCREKKGGDGSKNKKPQIEVEREPIGAMFMFPMLLQVTHPDWAAGAGEGDTIIAPIRKKEQVEWFIALRTQQMLRPLVEYGKQVLKDCATAVTQDRETVLQARALMYADFMLRVIENSSPNEEAHGRHGLTREAAATILLLLNKLTMALQSSTFSAHNSFNIQRNSAGKRPGKIEQTNRLVACESALLVELWLLAHERKVAHLFENNISIIHRCLISSFALTTHTLKQLSSSKSATGDGDAYHEMLEWAETLTRGLNDLRRVSVTFDETCQNNEMFLKAMHEGESIEEKELHTLLESLEMLHH